VPAAVAISLLAVPVLHAQSYPVKPVRIVVSWPPGGSNDVVARVMAQQLTEALGQTFVIDNRAGATGVIGTDIVAKSAPDGYTILVTSATHVANAHTYKNLPYDTMRDLTGVMPLAVQVGMLVVHPALPANSVKELIALAKSKPDQIAWASTGTGSYTWLTMAQLLQMTGTKMLEIPYKGGGPAVIALMAGETQVFFVGIGSLTSALPAKRVRPLGVASDKRLKRTTNGVSSVYVVANAISNQVVFTAENHLGQVLSNNYNNRVIGLTLQFYQLQYPVVAVGPGNYYDWYQLQCRVTKRTLD